MHRRGVSLVEVVFLLSTILVFCVGGLMMYQEGVFSDNKENNSTEIHDSDYMPNIENPTKIHNSDYIFNIINYNNIILAQIRQLDFNNPHHDVSLYTTDVLNKSGLLKTSSNPLIHLIKSQAISKNHLQLVYEIRTSPKNYSSLIDAAYFHDKSSQGYNIKLVSLLTNSFPAYLTYEVSDK